MLWNSHRLTAAIRCPVTSEAYPTIRASFVTQTTVFWDFYCDTILILLTKSPVAVYFLHAKPSFDVTILRRNHFLTFISDTLEQPIALPLISGRCKIGIFRNSYCLTEFSDILKTVIAFPAAAVGATRQICVFW
ncbi:hypothetical protein RA28_05560 [Ruegeria sp. ANG-S4]|nr:hypothetical protein RA28_05560 [Ruegeria sp. ANG-S4]